jgi:hypothetical protein
MERLVGFFILNSLKVKAAVSCRGRKMELGFAVIEVN